MPSLSPVDAERVNAALAWQRSPGSRARLHSGFPVRGRYHGRDILVPAWTTVAVSTLNPRARTLVVPARFARTSRGDEETRYAGWVRPTPSQPACILLALIGVGAAGACGLAACGDSEGGGAGAAGVMNPFGNAPGSSGGGSAVTGGNGGVTLGGAPAGAGGADASGTGGAGGAGVAGGAGGADAGAAGTGGAGTSGGGADASGAGGGGAMGMQPLGAICANDGNCSQAMGEAVCCIDTCTLPDQCPSGPLYLPCDRGSDCARYGGGKVCCELSSMRFCTKPSACGGRTLP